MKVANIDPGSPLFGYVRPGDKVVSINGTEVLDSIDFYYKTSHEKVVILFADPKGEQIEFDFDELMPGELGLTLEEGKIRVCKNDCIFCFIRQQPQGMRRALYVKDEDYRLSFTHGNFVTLSNTTDADIKRIIEQRLSPMYVSVHATDDKLRRCMLRNEKLDPIIPRLKALTDNGITVHTQTVLCPGINDGENLERTITDLASLHPGIETLAVVPVGLTKYRDHLPGLRNYKPDEAKQIIDFIGTLQDKYLKQHGTRFVWAADEFYVAANMEFPNKAFYEEMSQFENGIGMVREFITMFNRRRKQLKEIKSDKKALFLTGYSALPFLNKEIAPQIENLNISFEPVKNDFWGHSVTVSGLLTGQDLLKHARSRINDFDVAVLPPNCLNNDDLFLDNMSLEQFQTGLGKEVFIGQYNLAETIKEIFA